MCSHYLSFSFRFYTELVLRTGAPRSKKIIKVGDGVLIANADENIPYVATVEAFYTDSEFLTFYSCIRRIT